MVGDLPARGRHSIDGRHADEPRPLRIGLVAPPWLPVPPTGYGGTELVVDLLARGLAAAGHDVVLFTTGESTCPVPRLWHHPTALGTTAAAGAELEHVAEAYAALRAIGVDVVHDHTVLGPQVGHPPPGVPVVTTVHSRLDAARRAHYGAVARRGVAIVAISEAQRRTAPELPVAAVIHHGIDVAATRLGTGDGGHLLFLGRMSPDKGVDIAIEVARRSGRPLVIAAKMWEPDEVRFHDEVVRPLLGDGVTYVGPVAGPAKDALLEGAVALLDPLRWPEPFGLVMVEAMARGTPVLAFPQGAAAEIVEPGITGFHCRDALHMAALVDRAAALDRRACRRRAQERFDVGRMVAAHVALYRRLLDAGTPGSAPAVAGAV